MKPTGPEATRGDVHAALAAVDDPEHPGVSIVDLGLIEGVRLKGRRVEVDLVPTFSGCPARSMIAADVRTAVEAVDGVDDVEVRWLDAVAWSPDRVTATGRQSLAEGFTVVLRGSDGGLVCPVCGSGGVVDTAEIGPTRCRSLAWCPDCRNPVEVLR